MQAETESPCQDDLPPDLVPRCNATCIIVYEWETEEKSHVSKSAAEAVRQWKPRQARDVNLTGSLTTTREGVCLQVDIKKSTCEQHRQCVAAVNLLLLDW